MKNEFKEVVGAEESSIFDAHLAILDDPVFMNEIQGIIERQYKAAEVAVKKRSTILSRCLICWMMNI